MPSLRLAVRTLVRSPFVTLVAVFSLALGIGANTAIFSLIQGFLLRSVPAAAPDELVNVLAQGPNPGSQSCNAAGGCAVVFSYPMFRDLENGQTVFTGLAAHRSNGADLAFRGKSVSGEGMGVSGSYFTVLGLKPALGRLLGPEDDRAIGSSPVAVLSHRFWTSELGADPSVLNQTILVNGIALTIVGVAPPGFDGTTLGTRARVFVPITLGKVTGWEAFEDRRSYWVYLFARLKPGVTIEQAGARLNALYHPIVNDVEVPLQSVLPDEMLARFKAKEVRLEPGSQGQSQLRRQTATPLILLIGLTTIVLLVACTNVANLLLARAASRAAEMAVRSSLGAQRSQLIGQLVTDYERLLGFAPELRCDRLVDEAVPANVAEELLSVAREALSNVARHADASIVTVRVSVVDEPSTGLPEIRLVISDNGVGLVARPTHGRGLTNMRERAERLGGHFEIDPGDSSGTVLRWAAPLPDRAPR